jgi:ElaB/YqjD/DUF883 family membrane-anchored ribosome-binding protein
MYKEIKVVDVLTGQPITDAHVKFFDENGNYFKPWPQTDSKGMVSVDDPRAERGNSFSIHAPGYRSETLQLKDLESFNNGFWVVTQSGVVYLIDNKTFIEETKKRKEQDALRSGTTTLEQIRIANERERIANEAKAQINKLTGIVNGVFQGASFSLKSRLSSVLSSVQKLTQSPYSNVREGASQLLTEAQDLQIRIDAMEKDLNQIIKDFDAYVADLKAKQLASLK